MVTIRSRNALVFFSFLFLFVCLFVCLFFHGQLARTSGFYLAKQTLAPHFPVYVMWAHTCMFLVCHRYVLGMTNYTFDKP